MKIEFLEAKLDEMKNIQETKFTPPPPVEPEAVEIISSSASEDDKVVKKLNKENKRRLGAKSLCLKKKSRCRLSFTVEYL